MGLPGGPPLRMLWVLTEPSTPAVSCHASGQIQVPATRPPSVRRSTSLAIAIGYPDLISITNTTLNKTGQAIEAIGLAMAVYLAVSVSLSLAMNAYNAAILRRGGRTT